MHILSRRFALPIAAVFLLTALPLAAQDVQNHPAGTIVVDQKSDIDAVGQWTIIQPSHESFERTDAKLTITSMTPGRYTFQSKQPSGTSTHIDLLLGDDVVATSDTPQVTFDLADKMTLTLLVTYRLTIYGKVGVNSDPVGVPFNLQGPNGLEKTGITPAEFSPFPVGNYSVTYAPAGCQTPPPAAGSLIKDGRIDFMVKIVCSTFQPAETERKSAFVTTTVGAETVAFTDVPINEWFAPYVATVLKRGIMSGYSDARGALTGQFGPGDPVTIAQLAKIAHTVTKTDENAVTAAPLNPLARGQWFTRYVASAEELGWLVYVDGTVDPNRPATRGEVVATLLQIFDIPMRWPQGTVFTDVQRKTRYSGAIETAAAEKIVSGEAGQDGKPTGLFHPDNPITRAEISKILITVREKYQANSSSTSE